MENQPDFRTQIPRAQENYHNLEWHTSEITAGMMFHLADGTITGCNPEAALMFCLVILECLVWMGYTLIQIIRSKTDQPSFGVSIVLPLLTQTTINLYRFMGFCPI
jgi:hypothetical protein